MDTVTTLTLLLCFVVTTSAETWTSKARLREYRIATLHRGHHVEREPCEDDMTDCKNLNHLCHYPIIKNKCKITCGTCERTFGQRPDCNLSKFKCCWDNVTAARGPNYEGCRPCEDSYPECKYFKGQCMGRNGANYRLQCPVTCNVGCEHKQCLDNKYQKDVCKLYRKFKFCEASPALMRKMCRKTCGFCW